LAIIHGRFIVSKHFLALSADIGATASLLSQTEGYKYPRWVFLPHSRIINAPVHVTPLFFISWPISGLRLTNKIVQNNHIKYYPRPRKLPCRAHQFHALNKRAPKKKRKAKRKAPLKGIKNCYAGVCQWEGNGESLQPLTAGGFCRCSRQKRILINSRQSIKSDKWQLRVRQKKSEEKLNKGGGGRRKNTETLEAPNSV